MRWVVVNLLLLLWSSEASPVKVSCKNEKNQDVDWYILYKPPGRENPKPSLTGLKYIYIDANGKRVMSKPINDGDGVLANTLRPMLGSVRNMPPSFGFLSYNDQSPGASANPKMFGHSKGVVLGDSGSKTALWLTHSTPQFPFRRNQNHFYPDTGIKNGQSFMCVSLPFTDLEKVGEHLKNIREFPFDYDLPSGFPQELRDAADWKHSDSFLGKFQTLKIGNKELRMMAKPVSYTAKDGDLYVKLADGLKSDMDAQTWGCQPNRDESFCDINRKHVMNVEKIDSGDKELGSWSTKNDHSKWAVTTEKDITWTCFGDVNRAASQYERWGGALCINHSDVNKFYKAFAQNPLPCRKRPRPCSDSEIYSQIEALAESFDEKVEL
ncbi:plancitoxin-1-like [Eucyclogobius newberryi]|uniref:plancitoxin-1-like n=1 Tax=Eucyclogobius newberryi TaxID=166745 RepID=UPI003B5934D0